MRDQRDEQYARVLVETCIDVQPGWQVVVVASPLARPLLEAVCRALAHRGAYALVRTLYGLGTTPGEWVKEAPEELLRVQAPLVQQPPGWIADGEWTVDAAPAGETSDLGEQRVRTGRRGGVRRGPHRACARSGGPRRT